MIAIDSSMGERHDIGSIALQETGIYPGMVAQSGVTFDEFIHLVRMSLVVQITNFIVTGLLNAFDNVNLTS